MARLHIKSMVDARSAANLKKVQMEYLRMKFRRGRASRRTSGTRRGERHPTHRPGCNGDGSMIELDPEDVAIGQSGDDMLRVALRLIGRVHHDAFRMNGVGRSPLSGWTACERSTLPLPNGCWDDDRSPYSMAVYSADRWCDACIACAALAGRLPKPEVQIDISAAPGSRPRSEVRIHQSHQTGRSQTLWRAL